MNKLIKLFLKAHSDLPIYWTVDLATKDKIVTQGTETTIPAIGSLCKISFDNYTASFFVGEVVPRNERICIYSSEHEVVTLRQNGHIVPWIASGNSHILVI